MLREMTMRKRMFTLTQASHGKVENVPRQGWSKILNKIIELHIVHVSIMCRNLTTKNARARRGLHVSSENSSVVIITLTIRQYLTVNMNKYE